MYKCPFCHSTNIEKEKDYNELKKELKNIMATDGDSMPPELRKMLSEAIVYDLYSDEEYLKNLEIHGLTLFCKDCGNVFKENDKVDEENFIPPTEISKEEFENIVLEGFRKQNKTIIEADTIEKERLFLQMVCGKRKKYYVETANKIVKDLEETSKMLDEIELEEETDNNLLS